MYYIYLFMGHIDSVNEADEYQFGFQKGLSTGTCTHILKQAAHYYRQRGSHVLCCIIDFSKAFDNVDYRLLSCKLLDYNKSNSCLICVRLCWRIGITISLFDGRVVILLVLI